MPSFQKLHDLLEKIIDEEDMDNPVLKKNSYSNFTDKAIQYLSVVFQKFPQPYLVKVSLSWKETLSKLQLTNYIFVMIFRAPFIKNTCALPSSIGILRNAIP